MGRRASRVPARTTGCSTALFTAGWQRRWSRRFATAGLRRYDLATGAMTVIGQDARRIPRAIFAVVFRTASSWSPAGAMGDVIRVGRSKAAPSKDADRARAKMVNVDPVRFRDGTRLIVDRFGHARDSLDLDGKPDPGSAPATAPSASRSRPPTGRRRVALVAPEPGRGGQPMRAIACSAQTDRAIAFPGDLAGRRV